MTPQERAEKIAADLFTPHGEKKCKYLMLTNRDGDFGCKKHDDHGGWGEQAVAETLAAAITEAVNDALERAAKVADEQFESHHSAMEGAGEPDFSHYEGAADAYRHMAARIRQLKETPHETE